MGLVFTIFFIIVILVIFGVFRDSLFGANKSLNPIHIILSLVFIICLWYFFRWLYLKYKSLDTLTEIESGLVQQTIESKKLSKSNSNNFTISTWFYVNDWNYRYGQKKVLLKRNTDTHPSPHITLGEIDNDIVVSLFCYNSSAYSEHGSGGSSNRGSYGSSRSYYGHAGDWGDGMSNANKCRTMCGLTSQEDTTKTSADRYSVNWRPCTTSCKTMNCGNCTSTGTTKGGQTNLTYARVDQLKQEFNSSPINTGSASVSQAATAAAVASSSTASNGTKFDCTVRNFPIQKWVNLIVSVYGRTLDIYIDGKLVKTCVLPGIAKISKDNNIIITPDNGFNGWTSNTIYKPTSSNPQEAYNIYKRGYGSAWYNSLFNKYKIKVSLLKDNIVSGSIQI